MPIAEMLSEQQQLEAELVQPHSDISRKVCYNKQVIGGILVMKKLIASCLAVMIALTLCVAAYAEPRAMAEQCPKCMYDATMRVVLDGVHWTERAHEDHVDLIKVLYYEYCWTCTRSDCGYSWTEYGYTTQTVDQCPFYG